MMIKYLRGTVVWGVVTESWAPRVEFKGMWVILKEMYKMCELCGYFFIYI